MGADLTDKSRQWRLSAYPSASLTSCIVNGRGSEQICSRILDEKMKVRNDAVIIENRATQQLIYRPPTGYGNLIRLLTNLERFINDKADGLQPLVKMAVMHYQFEAIHPFMDGNGRTGRILNILYLVCQRLLDVPILYLSRFFIQNHSEYYRYLREGTEKGSWHQWILYIIDAVEQTSRDTADKIQAIDHLINNVMVKARGKTKAAEREGFVDLLFKWPYCKISIVEKELGCSRITATRYLNETAGLGLLERVKMGRELYCHRFFRPHPKGRLCYNTISLERSYPMAKRRKFTPEFKAEVVLEVLSGATCQAEVCRRRT